MRNGMRREGNSGGLQGIGFRVRMSLAVLSACALSVAFAFVSGAGPGGCGADADSDGVCDVGSDNCVSIANPSQRDDDEDGYGNLCDTDVNQDCNTGTVDLGLIFGQFGTSSPWSPKNTGAFDVNEDNGVGTVDLGLVFGEFGNPPGPSSRSCADCTAVPTLGLGLGVCP